MNDDSVAVRMVQPYLSLSGISSMGFSRRAASARAEVRYLVGLNRLHQKRGWEGGTAMGQY